MNGSDKEKGDATKGASAEREGQDRQVHTIQVHTIPVVEEQVELHQREVQTGAVRVNKLVHTREVVVDEPLVDEDVEVRRRTVDEFVDEVVPIRQQGDTTIISIYEEVLVVEKRLKIKEEVHIIRRRREGRRPQKVTLRSEEAVIHRSDNQGGSPSS